MSVGVSHRLADRLEDADEPGEIIRGGAPLIEQGGEGPAAYELHGEERAMVGEDADVVDRNDSRVLELPSDLRLLDEAADHRRAVAMIRKQHFHRELTPERRVAAQEDGPHPAPGDLTEDLVAPRRRRRGDFGRARQHDGRGFGGHTREHLDGAPPVEDGPGLGWTLHGGGLAEVHPFAEQTARAEACGAPAGRAAPQRGQ